MEKKIEINVFWTMFEGFLLGEKLKMADLNNTGNWLVSRMSNN